VLCPTKQQCINGECTAQLDAGTDAETGAGGTAGGDGQAGGPGQGGSATSDSGSVLDEKGRWGLATGGGGCACKVGSDARTTNAGIALALASLGLLVSRRRKRDSEEK
jgi:MYXO-CTERM domain-containing protein